jgi:hypothetical protein
MKESCVIIHLAWFGTIGSVIHSCHIIHQSRNALPNVILNIARYLILHMTIYSIPVLSINESHERIFSFVKINFV